jgi:acyl dehydratase
MGFPRPILHGLCSYGIATRAVVAAALDGDPGRVRTVEARFAGIVFPGETIRTSVWVEPDRILFSADIPERDNAPALAGGEITTGGAA